MPVSNKEVLKKLEELIEKKREEMMKLQTEVIYTLVMSSRDFQEFKEKIARISGYVQALEDLRLELVKWKLEERL